jgi:hypothetical protein
MRLKELQFKAQVTNSSIGQQATGLTSLPEETYSLAQKKPRRAQVALILRKIRRR